MRRIKIVLFLLFCFLLTRYTYAQDTSYVYQDSSISNVDSVFTRPIVTEERNKVIFQQDDFADASLNQQNIIKINDSAEALKKNAAFAYAKNLDSLLKLAQKNQETRSLVLPTAKSSWLESFFTSNFTKLFFWSLAVFFVGFILYKLLLTEGIFKRQISKSNVLMVNQTEERNAQPVSYQNLITQAINNKNYRLATRYHYLQTLQKLASKGLIQFTADKTNLQYSTELNGNPVRESFLALTLNYEYAWYGDFNITDTMFEKIQNNFIAFNNNLS